MKLVIVWHVSDGYTYSCEVTQPVEYDSPEKLLVDWEQWKKSNPEPVFYAGEGFAGTDLGPEIEEHDLEVYTLEEWFDKCKPQEKLIQ